MARIHCSFDCLVFGGFRLIVLQVFPDWFSANIQSFWTDALRNWSELGVGFSGIWLDMNEASSFCSYSWYVVCAVKMLWW